MKGNMPNDQSTKIQEAIAQYKLVKGHASQVVTRLSRLQRSASKKPGGWPWGKAVANVEESLRACSEAEDRGWAKVAEWANANE